MKMKIKAKQRLKADDSAAKETSSPHDSTLNNVLKHIVEASNAANLIKHTLRGAGDNQRSSLLRELQETLDQAAQTVHDIKAELQEQVVDSEPSETAESISAMLLSNSEPVVDADIVSDGSAFETLTDGDPSQDEPIVQELTEDDGGIQPADEQSLLMDDIPYRRA